MYMQFNDSWLLENGEEIQVSEILDAHLLRDVRFGPTRQTKDCERWIICTAWLNNRSIKDFSQFRTSTQFNFTNLSWFSKVWWVVYINFLMSPLALKALYIFVPSTNYNWTNFKLRKRHISKTNENLSLPKRVCSLSLMTFTVNFCILNFANLWFSLAGKK